MKEGWQHDKRGGGLRQKSHFLALRDIFGKNDLYHENPHKILDIIDITYVYLRVPL